MKHGTTIVAELESYLRREHLTISKFAELSGLHSGTLSNIINGQRPIAMKQLDQMTEAMNQPEGYYYELFVENYIMNRAADWRRIGPLLKRCAELEKHMLIRQVVNHSMENLAYATLLFEAAEELFAEGYKAAAAVIYECVAEGERLQHSERLALCRYRLFTIALSDNHQSNLHAANQFDPYIERLDEVDQLDAIKLIIDVYGSLHQWDRMEYWAEQLERKGKAQYLYISQKSSHKRPIREVIYYILYSYLMRGQVWEERGDFVQAQYYNTLTADFSWIRTPYSDTEIIVMEQFKEWSIANDYLFRMLSGEVEIIPAYIEFVENLENEIAPALFYITQAANRFDLNIDGLLERFKDRLYYHNPQSRIGGFNSQLIDDKNTRFLAELALYHLRRERFDTGFCYLQESFESSVRTQSNDNMMRCIALFERYRSLASSGQKQQFFADNFLSYDSWYWGVKSS
ncbi:helix-turn-helix domain-containing protein [Paenibacillus tengchongensis]|uniref:helix-turn-helix domain-containing protein n=1 Tax=Paenibacillus tengchongensis TaxID=2608684 RepID=UPI00124CC475|nr:transcriptional regulator [Paenibacillus tengchongensis]